jgi:predicted nucleotidyltransferase
MSELVDRLLEWGFLTGSQAFGTAREDSDIDIVYSIQDSDRIAQIIGPVEQRPSSYFAGYTIDDNGKQVNLIPVHPHEFLPWFLATKALTATLKDSGIIDPIKKYAIFQGIVCFFKGTVAELRNIDEYDKLKERILGKKQDDFIIDDFPV